MSSSYACQNVFIEQKHKTFSARLSGHLNKLPLVLELFFVSSVDSIPFHEPGSPFCLIRQHFILHFIEMYISLAEHQKGLIMYSVCLSVFIMYSIKNLRLNCIHPLKQVLDMDIVWIQLKNWSTFALARKNKKMNWEVADCCHCSSSPDNGSMQRE